MKITKRLEFDYGHRVPSHNSKCKNIHGHRGTLEIRLEGKIKGIDGKSDDGMVIDFADIKRIATELIIDKWDHAFIVYSGDKPIINFLSTLPDHKTVKYDFIPTAENLALEAFRILSVAYQVAFQGNLFLDSVRFYETPNSWADADSADGTL